MSSAPDYNGIFEPRLAARKRAGKAASAVFLACTAFAIVALSALLFGVVDKAFGYAAIAHETRFEDVSPEGKAVDAASDAELIAVIRDNAMPRVVSAAEERSPLETRDRKFLLAMLEREVLVPSVERVWPLSESLFGAAAIRSWTAENAPGAELVFRSWANPEFLAASQSSDALYAGIRGAVIGSFMTILLTILVAFPIGTAAAVWLEEYAPDNALSRFISTNIYNLSGVPSIIYGMLGLAVFVRGLAPVTSGTAFGLGEADSASGRTVLSASLTLALLILPVIIINAQEAIRAVPRSLRHSSLAVGATKWQTIWHHVLPSSMDRILTGAVLGVSRAVGETAPLVVVGASAFLSRDPVSPFSRFTTLPIQIYQWTSYPEEEFRHLAAGAILVLIVLLVALNATAISLRNKYRKERRS